MSIPSPVFGAYTIYTKRDCVYCDMVKHLLRDKRIHLVECDGIDTQTFLEFMDKLTIYRQQTFPYVFKDNVFIGGFEETEIYENQDRSSLYKDDF